MAQKETLTSLIHGNFARELSISDGKTPLNAVDSLVKEASLKDKEGLSGILFGFKAVDKETGGWQNPDLIIIAARPAMGKLMLKFN